MIAEKMGNVAVIKTIDAGREHISLSKSHQLPSWNEVKKVREKYCDPKKFYVMVLPPKEYYVDVHPYCFHLWEVLAEEEIEIWKGM